MYFTIGWLLLRRNIGSAGDTCGIKTCFVGKQCVGTRRYMKNAAEVRAHRCGQLFMDRKLRSGLRICSPSGDLS